MLAVASRASPMAGSSDTTPLSSASALWAIEVTGVREFMISCDSTCIRSRRAAASAACTSAWMSTRATMRTKSPSLTTSATVRA